MGKPLSRSPGGGEGEKLENLRQSIHRILWTYGGVIKLLRKSSKR